MPVLAEFQEPHHGAIRTHGPEHLLTLIDGYALELSARANLAAGFYCSDFTHGDWELVETSNGAFYLPIKGQQGYTLTGNELIHIPGNPRVCGDTLGLIATLHTYSSRTANWYMDGDKDALVDWLADQHTRLRDFVFSGDGHLDMDEIGKAIN